MTSGTDLFIQNDLADEYGLNPEDIRHMEDIGINGLKNCKVQRTYLPSSLGVNVMADTLWNKECDFEGIAERVLKEEFGAMYFLMVFQNRILKAIKNSSELFLGNVDN